MRSYEYKEETYVQHEKGSWAYPSYEKYHEVSSPSIHKMLHKPSFQHSTLSSYGHHDEDDDMVLNGTRWDDAHGWCGTHHHLTSGNLTVKKNEHQASTVNYDRHGEHGKAVSGTHWGESRGWGGTHSMNNNNFIMGGESILRPPLGAVNPPSHHRHHQCTMYERSGQAGVTRDGRPYFLGEGSARQSMSMMVNNSSSSSNKNWMEASKRDEDYDHGTSNNSNWMKASKKYEDYDARLQEELESLIKELHESGFSGEVVHKIEVIEYERRRYGGGLIRAYPEIHSIYHD